MTALTGNATDPKEQEREYDVEPELLVDTTLEAHGRKRHEPANNVKDEIVVAVRFGRGYFGGGWCFGVLVLEVLRFDALAVTGGMICEQSLVARLWTFESA